jgi:hypothetical protein
MREQIFDQSFFLCYSIYCMSLFGSTNMPFSMRISKYLPWNFIQIIKLRSLRQQSLFASIEEDLVAYKMRLSAIYSQQRQLNLEWKELNSNLKTLALELAKQQKIDAQTSHSSLKFLSGFQELVGQNKPEQTITQLESLVTKVLRYQNLATTDNQSVDIYKEFLHKYLCRLQSELNYWKLDQEKSALEKTVGYASAKLESIRQDHNGIFGVFGVFGI